VRRPDRPFDVHELRFKSRDEAEDWIDRNQLGRRNLTHDSFRLLLGRRTIRAKAGQGYRSDLSHSAKSDAVEEVASDAGVNVATAYRAAKFAEAVETLGIEAAGSPVCCQRPARGRGERTASTTVLLGDLGRARGRGERTKGSAEIFGTFGESRA